MNRTEGQNPVSAEPNRTRATVGGVGGGTGVVAIAQAVGPTTALGALLLYSAPTIAYVAGAGVYFIEVQASRFLERRMAKGARKTIFELLQNPLISAEGKDWYRQQLELLEGAMADAELARVKSLGVLSFNTKFTVEVPPQDHLRTNSTVEVPPQ